MITAIYSIFHGRSPDFITVCLPLPGQPNLHHLLPLQAFLPSSMRPAGLQMKNKFWSEISSRPFVNVTCFIPDKRKSGGSYMTISGNLIKIDTCEKQIIFTNGIKTDFDDIIEISRG